MNFERYGEYKVFDNFLGLSISAFEKLSFSLLNTEFGRMNKIDKSAVQYALIIDIDDLRIYSLQRHH